MNSDPLDDCAPFTNYPHMLAGYDARRLVELRSDKYAPNNDTITRAIDRILGWSHGGIEEALGQMGLRALTPDFYDGLEERVELIVREAYWDASCTVNIERGRESSKRTGDMVVAMLRATTKGLGPKDTALVALGAHAGIDPDEVLESPLLASDDE